MQISFKIIAILALQISLISALEFDLDFGDVDENAIPAALLRGANEAYDINLQGLDKLGEGDLHKAMELFSKASRTIPNYSDAQNNMAVVYLRKGNIGAARDLWLKVVSFDPQYATAWYNLGIVAEMYGKTDEAAGYFERALANNLGFSEALVMLGKMRFKQGEIKKGHQLLKRAYDLRPDAEIVWGSFAYSLLSVGDTVKAEEILLNHSDHPEALKMLGEIAATQKRNAEAINFLIEAGSRGSDPSVYGTIARLRWEAENPCGALTALEEYLSRSSNPEADAYNLGGIAAKECGDLKRAAELFNEGARRFSGDAVLKFNSGAMLFRERKYKAAYEKLATVSDTMNDPELYRMRIVSLLELKRNTEALKELKIGLSKYPFNSKMLDIKGSLLYKQGDIKGAEKAFSKALSLDPMNQSARFNLSLCKGEYSSLTVTKTIESFKERVKNCVENCESAILNLARLYAFNKRNSEAIELLKGKKLKKLESVIFLSKLLNSNGNTIAALNLLKKASQSFILTEELKLELAEAYLSKGIHTEAITFLKDIENSNKVDKDRVLYQLGYANMKLSNYVTAAGYFEKYKGDRKGISGFLGFIYNELGESEKAEKNWKKSVEKDPQNVMMWVNLALLHHNKGEFKEAVANYQKAMELPGASSEIYVNIALTYESLKDYEKAVENYEKAFNGPGDKSARYNLALLYARQESLKKLQEVSDTIRIKYPSSAESKRVEGELSLLRKNFKRTVEIFSSITEKVPEDNAALARAYMHLGEESKMNVSLNYLPNEEKWKELKKELRSQIAFTLGNYEEAYDKLKSSSFASFKDRYNIALLAFKSGDFKTAYDSATTLVKKSSGDDKFNLMKLAGNSAIKLKDWEGADLWWSYYFELKNDDPLAAYNIAVAAYNMDDINRAMKYYRKAQEIDSSIKNVDIEKKYSYQNHRSVKDTVVLGELDSMYNHALELQNLGRLEEARKVYEEIVDKDDRYYRAWNNMGAIYGAEGKLEKAIKCYKNAVSRRADIIDGYANLVNIYIALEDVGNARRWLKKGYRLDPENDILKQLESGLQSLK